MLVLGGVFHLNGDFLPGNDSKASLYLPLSVLYEGNLTFTPLEVPFMFSWELQHGGGAGTASTQKESVQPLDAKFRYEGKELAELLAAGEIQVTEPRYYLIPSERRGEYLSSYGVGAGLSALPLVALTQVVYGDLRERHEVLWPLAKTIAALFTAAAAVLLYLTARRWVSPLPATLLAVAFGLGTCMWSAASQALLQHGPNTFYLGLAVWLWTRSPSGPKSQLLCGAALAAATACRPTSAIVLLSMGLVQLLRDRRGLLFLALGAAPLLAALGWFQWVHLGSPLRFGQDIAIQHQGIEEVWSTPLLDGLLGLLFSPSRGLLVFSPFLWLAAPALFLVWRRPAFAPLRALALASVAILLIQAKWHYWWGGWSYGPRIIVDLTWIWTLLLIALVPFLSARRWRVIAAGLLLLSSIGIQAVGAFAFNLQGWNFYHAGYEVQGRGQEEPVVLPTLQEAEAWGRKHRATRLRPLRLDVNEHPERTWDWTNSQILYYCRNFSAARQRKHQMMKTWIENPQF
jgi:hypothetical protein